MKVCTFEGELVTEISKALAETQRKGLMVTHIELTGAEYKQLGRELGGDVWAFPMAAGIPLVVDGKRVEPSQIQLPKPKLKPV